MVPERLIAPLYGFAEADRIAKVTRGTAKRWIEGYSYGRPDGVRVTRPPITLRRPGAGDGVSFRDLIEVVAIGGFKEHGLSIASIRRIVAACQQLFREPYPLSAYAFKVGGRDVFVGNGDVLHDVLRHRGAMAWDEVLGPFLATLDYRDSFAFRWWPLGRSKPIVVDPEFGFGLPVILGSGVKTEIVRERFEVGDSIEQISYDFNITPIEVESAIQFELNRAA